MTWNVTHAQGELLAQLRPSGTGAVTLFKAGELRAEITLIIAAVREGGSSTEVRLYHDDSGNDVYGDDTIILGETKVETDQDNIFQAQHPGSGIHIKPNGSLGVSVNDADEVNFSVYGITETLAERVRGLT